MLRRVTVTPQVAGIEQATYQVLGVAQTEHLGFDIYGRDLMACDTIRNGRATDKETKHGSTSV